ncbi:MAG: hypothetical protein J7J76_06100 [Candidatus Latescibacteria bacterium]|nr:hypothetical protein [Candidatus Latescibacterota bacterium]
MEAGRHVLIWSGKNEEGNEVSCGLYPCRVMAGQLAFTGKMLILR